MSQDEKILNELQLLEVIEMAEVAKNEYLCFMNTALDSPLFDLPAKVKNEYLLQLFLEPMSKEEILKTCRQENLRTPSFIAILGTNIHN